MDTTICVEWDDFVESAEKEVKRKLILTIPNDLNVFEFAEELKKIMHLIGYHRKSIERCFKEDE